MRDFDNTPTMDEADSAWVSTMVPGLIPEGSLINGFVVVVSYIRPDGENDWRTYNTLDAPLSTILGLLQMAGYTYMVDNTREIGDNNG